MARQPLIYIVDDSEMSRQSISALLETRGFAVEAFASADDFLRSQHIADGMCLLLDIQMPKMNGIELHRNLLGAGFNIPTIFLTAFPEKGIRKQVMAAGAIDCLTKPFRTTELLSSIRIALEQRGQDEAP